MTIEVKPLDAIVYNQEKVNMADVIAPPYDVILDDYRDELEARSQYNIVKLILANNSTDLSDENNRYNEAFRNCQKWLSENILIKTKGYGHGVGLSQYGANNMAKLGYRYDEILKYYYQNTEITNL